uniref:Uncharacterized protein n=1 Tax=Moniliophthora roreri TaxID=221103 RepID=A0A0W0GFT5_MONRR
MNMIAFGLSETGDDRKKSASLARDTDIAEWSEGLKVEERLRVH